MSRPPVDLRNRHKAALLAWLVPGLGHFYQGRRAKAALYASCILGLFVAGMWLGDWNVMHWKWIDPRRDMENFRASFLCQLPLGLPAILALIQSTLQYYEIPTVLWGFLAAPTTQEINALHAHAGKLVEVGWVYTVVAGLLNVLAIYDALEGPALSDEEAPAPLTEPASEGRSAEAAGAPGRSLEPAGPEAVRPART